MVMQNAENVKSSVCHILTPDKFSTDNATDDATCTDEEEANRSSLWTKIVPVS